MIDVGGLRPELIAAATAAGLIDASGHLDPDWFAHPLDKLGGMLTTPHQRDALLSVLGALAPSVPLPGVPAVEQWHPVLADHPRGNAYVTVRDGGSGSVVLGLAGRIATPPASAVGASVSIHLPLLSADGTLTEIAGTAEGPLQLDVTVRLPVGATSFPLEAVRFTARLAPIAGTSTIRLTLLGVDVGHGRVPEIAIDPEHLDSAAVDLVLALLDERLRDLALEHAADLATPRDLEALFRHLMPVLGRGGGLPPLSLVSLIRDPAAFRTWFAALLEGPAPAPIETWLAHVAGLLGAGNAPAVRRSVTGDAWSVRVLDVAANAGIDLALATRVAPSTGLRTVLIGARLEMPSGAPVLVESGVTFAAIPLAGAEPARVVPEASAGIRVTGGGGAPLVVSANVSVAAAHGGVRWNGTALGPFLELEDVTLQGTHYGRLDLSSADAVVAAAGQVVIDAIRVGLGNATPGRQLAALIGLLPPAHDPATPHLLSPIAAAAQPTRAIGALHHAVLGDAAHPWSHMLEEIADLLGLPPNVVGAGTVGDPWRVAFAGVAPLEVQLAAWNAQAGAGDPQQLRLGVRVEVVQAPWQSWWLAEVLAFDLFAAEEGRASLVGGQHFFTRLAPLPEPPLMAGAGLRADAAQITADWIPGGPLRCRASITNVEVSGEGRSVVLPSLELPPPAGFDATLADLGLGLAIGELESLFRLLVSRGAFHWGGMTAFALAGLSGWHGGLRGLPVDWPRLGPPDPLDIGSLLGDPLGALRRWLVTAVGGFSSEGEPFLVSAMPWLQALLAGALPVIPGDRPRSINPPRGSGTYGDPWTVPVNGALAQPVELLAWLEPEGPPGAWAEPLRGQAASAREFDVLLDRAGALAPFAPELRDAMTGIDPPSLARALDVLAQHLSSSDGLVPLSSQVPVGGTWTAGATLNTAHHLLPTHPPAIQQVVDQVDAWAQPGGDRVVLLLSAPFAERASWADLLAEAEARRPGSTQVDAHFDLRIPNVDPGVVDLRGITAVASYYTADLGTGIPESAQVGRVVARIRQLRPGLPVILVAHSATGLAARAYTAANGALVRGLVTLGTPHAGAPLTPLRDAAVAEAVRFLQRLGLARLPAGSLRAAVEHLVLALDGGAPVAAGQLARLSPYPGAAFAAAGGVDTGGVPALAVGAQLTGDLFETVAGALDGIATVASTPGYPRPVPTHAGFGLRVGLGVPRAGRGDVEVDAALRVDLHRLELVAGAPAPARPDRRLSVDVSLIRPGGWLVGGAGAYAAGGALDARVRWAELGMVIEPDGAGVRVTPRLRLHDASYRAALASEVSIADANAPVLLGVVMRAISDPAPAPGSARGVLLDALRALGLAMPDPHGGGVGIAADAFTAVGTDAVGYLGPRLLAALGRPGGLVGFSAAPGGGWAMAVAGFPLEVSLAPNLGAVRIRSTSVPLGDGAELVFDGRLAVPGFGVTLDAGLTLGSLSLHWSGTGALVVEAPPWLDPVTLIPAPAAGALRARLGALVPRLLLSSAFSALLEAVLGDDWRVGPIDAILAEPGRWLVRPSALGNGSALDLARLTQLVDVLADLAGQAPSGSLGLPGGLTLTPRAVDADHVGLFLGGTLALPGAGSLTLDLGLSIDGQLSAAPGGSIAFDLQPGGGWGRVSVALGVHAGGLSLSVTPDGQSPIQLLPTFSGFGALAGAAQALLPRLLDEMVAALPGPRSALATAVLDLATTLDLYDAVNGFAGHAAQLRALGQPGWITAPGLPRIAITQRIAGLFAGASPLAAVPGAVTASGTEVAWSAPAPGGGTVSIIAGWPGGGPGAVLSLTNVRVGAIRVVRFSAGARNGAVACSLALQVDVPALPIAFTPELDVDVHGSGQFLVRLLPLGAAAPAFAITLAPTPAVSATAADVRMLVERWLLPLAVDLLLDAIRPRLGDRLWPNGPFLDAVLQGAGVLTAANARQSPLPTVATAVPLALAALANGVSVALTDHLSLSLVADGRLGVRLHGHADFEIGPAAVSVRFGEVLGSWLAEPNAGLAAFVFERTGPPPGFSFHPALSFNGVGLALSGARDTPLVDAGGFRLGAAAGYLFLEADLRNGVTVTGIGGGVELDHFGLPLGLVLPGGQPGSNPVAASLLRSDDPGGASRRGDTASVNPSITAAVYVRPNEPLRVRIGDVAGRPVWIPIQRGFGPLYIDKVGLAAHDESGSDPRMEVLLDGTVKVNGLTVQVDDLEIGIPLKSVLVPSAWSLDLQGLAVGFKSSEVSIAGGLAKDDGPPLEYRGVLTIDVAGRTFTALGAYARPSDVQGAFTSLFIFVVLPIVIGGPPYLFITGLAGGAGYNRQLLVPEDLDALPRFLLVSAIDDANLAEDPLGALLQIRDAIPPRRGSLWLAAGIRFTSFVVVHSVAVAYVALDRGLEIGLLGVTRMQLPPEGDAIASVELALKIRFSSAEGLLSIQAQLTDNSWLFSRDCQLTGGFAFFLWFLRGQFLLTLGGYHPAFQPLPEFPIVPRLGFRWTVTPEITIKGEAYFALTNSCVMAGGRLEAVYDSGTIRAWFIWYADFLVSWDPFHYDIAAGISIGVELNLEVCFLACVTIDIRVALGAALHVIGPPLHGEVTVEFEVASITVRFGDEPTTHPDYITDWGEFVAKYLTAGDPDGVALSAHAVRGLLAPEPPGAQPTPGTAAEPWKLSPEFALATETRMPTTAYTFVGQAGPALAVPTFDLAPMGRAAVESLHRVRIEHFTGGQWIDLAADGEQDPQWRASFRIDPNVGKVPEATWRFIEPDAQRPAANTLAALVGVQITATARARGQSALIPIARLVDDTGTQLKPLPFEVAGFPGPYLRYGRAAEATGAVTARARSSRLLDAAVVVLARGAQFADARKASGLEAAGLTPLAVRALREDRSAAPLLVPLSAGLGQRPVARGVPRPIRRVPPSRRVVLAEPRLRAVLQHAPQPTSDAPARVRTTIAAMAAAVAVPRMAPPELSPVGGARLERVAAATGPRPTTVSHGGRTLRHRDLGGSVGTAHAAAFTHAPRNLASDGLVVSAGTTHVWDLPAPSRDGQRIVIAESAAARVTCLTRAGEILGDRECAGGDGTSLALPVGTTRVAVACLGSVPVERRIAAAFGAVSATASPAGHIAATGWQAESLLQQIGATVLLARGACLVLPRPVGAATAQVMIRAAEATADQRGTETWLPIVTEVVMVLLDREDATAVDAGDLAIAARGATLSPQPSLVGLGARVAALYEVTAREAGADHVAIAVASRRGWRGAGVVGLAGRASEWAVRLRGGVPAQVVPDGPLTPSGHVEVRLLAAEGGDR